MLFRAIAMTVLMSALLFLYGLHPIAGWATLMLLFAGSVLLKKKARVVVED